MTWLTFVISLSVNIFLLFSIYFRYCSGMKRRSRITRCATYRRNANGDDDDRWIYLSACRRCIWHTCTLIIPMLRQRSESAAAVSIERDSEREERDSLRCCGLRAACLLQQSYASTRPSANDDDRIPTCLRLPHSSTDRQNSRPPPVFNSAEWFNSLRSGADN